jgi:hypothetical protein
LGIAIQNQHIGEVNLPSCRVEADCATIWSAGIPPKPLFSVVLWPAAYHSQSV